MSYLEKAKSSFNSKMKVFVFNAVIANKKEINLDDFIKYKLNEKDVDVYTKRYWQYMATDNLITTEGLPISIKQIELDIIDFFSKNEEAIGDLETKYINVFGEVFTKPEYEALQNQQTCHYCGLTKSDLLLMGEKELLRKKNYRGWSLEMDRKNPNLEYSKENCVMACYWCNNAKTDEFLEDEFLIIAEGIKTVWQNRFKNSDNQ